MSSRRPHSLRMAGICGASILQVSGLNRLWSVLGFRGLKLWTVARGLLSKCDLGTLCPRDVTCAEKKGVSGGGRRCACRPSVEVHGVKKFPGGGVAAGWGLCFLGT